MAKPTSLAAQIARTDQARTLENAKEDLAFSKLPAPKGKVWVRLIRQHLDGEGKLHREGPALLDEGKVPSSAKVLTEAVPASEAVPEE